MQDRTGEHNPAPPAVVLGVALPAVLVAVGLVELPRLQAGPLPEDCLAGSEGFWRARLLAAGVAVSAGWFAACLGLVGPLRRRAGVYGLLAAALAAALCLAAVPEPIRRSGEPLGWPAGLVVGLLGALLSPMLRERGIGSLVWPPLLLGLLLVHGRRAAMRDAERAEPLQRVQQALDAGGASPFLSVEPALPLDLRRALVLGVRRPFLERDVDLLMVDQDSPDEAWLSRLGGTALRLRGGQVAIGRGTPADPPPPQLDVQVRPGAGGAWGFAVGPPGTAYELRIITPTGVLVHHVDRDGLPAGLDDAGRQALARHVGPPLPAGLPVLVVAQRAGDPAAGGWAWVRTP